MRRKSGTSESFYFCKKWDMNKKTAEGITITVRGKNRNERMKIALGSLEALTGNKEYMHVVIGKVFVGSKLN